MNTLCWFGLEGLAAAIMYVEKEAFSLNEKSILCAPDPEVGQFLLDEIIQNGNSENTTSRRVANAKGG